MSKILLVYSITLLVLCTAVSYAAESKDIFSQAVGNAFRLAHKGETGSALKELDGVDRTKLDNSGKLILAEAYLRLRSPERSIDVLVTCPTPECGFYKGVTEYLTGENDKAISTFNSLHGLYDANRLNYYLKKIYESEGDKKHADEITLPDNYDINTD